MPTFLMLVGLPGCGKSTLAEKLKSTHFLVSGYKRKRPDAVILSSDSIRGELYGDENCQDNPEQVFKIMFDRTIQNLNDGFDVIYDATNINRKKRINLLKELNKKVKVDFNKYCFVVYTDLKECLKRNANRDRKVPEEAIYRMLKNFEIPVYNEGWNVIEIKYTTQPNIPYLTAVNDIVGPVPHDNHWHNMDVDLHMYCALDYFEVKFEAQTFPIYLKYAILYHDLGKKICKTFINRKGEKTDEAHFYQHANVGAYLAMGINFDGFRDHNFLGPINEFTEQDKYKMIVLINYHMRPLEAWKDSKKVENEDSKLLGAELYWYLKIIHECDEMSEQDPEWVERFLKCHLSTSYRKYGLNWAKYVDPIREEYENERKQ